MKTSSSDHLPPFPRSTISLVCWRAFVYLQKGACLVNSVRMPSALILVTDENRQGAFKHGAPAILRRVGAGMVCAVERIEGHHIHTRWREHG